MLKGSKYSKIGFPILICFLGVGIGYILGTHQKSKGSDAQENTNKNTALRLGGYKLISPLLVCDSVFTDVSPQLNNMQAKIEGIIQAAKDRGDISVASVYFRDIKTGGELNINGTEKFYPASLKKVPLMMQYYKNSELDSMVLTTKKVLSDSKDYNEGAAIPPKEFPVPGQSYTNQELIDYMIKYSDNVSFQALFQEMGVKNFNKIYTDMQLHYPDTVVAIEDFVTPYQFALFFRSLYNATYLNNANSEKALELLTQTEFKTGIVAGVPTDTVVAHKYGIGAVDQTSGNQVGELHDCGIVYNANNPYLICVMTKSVSEINQVEKVIAEISKAVYQEADKGYK